MNRTVYFYGSLPKEGQVPFGGGEVGNMRTIRMLEESGYSVVKIRKIRTSTSASKSFKIISYPFRMIKGFFETFIKLLFATRPCVFHLSGFAGNTIFNEFVLVLIAKVLNHYVVYELRGGGAIEFYERGSTLYRMMFKYILKKSDYIFTQGKENIPLIKSISNSPIFHYANCVETSFVPLECPIKSKDVYNLLFYGRLEEDKHVDIVVKATAILQKEYPNATLTVVGNGQKKYQQSVETLMNTLLMPDSYKLLPGCEHDDLKQILKDKHFYIFPSTQIREGQSNAVTESMSYGIIPIVSPQGFNRSTVGNDILVVDDLTPIAYANRVLDLIRSGKVPILSKEVYERYNANYSESVVFTNALNEYSKIFKSVVIR